MSDAPHIGMQVWRFDPNRRHYRRDASGRAIGSPIWREHWEPLEIIGETSRSWLVGRSGQPLKWADKYPKKEWPANLATSQEQIDRKEVVEHRYAIARRVESCTDYDALIAITQILGAIKTEQA